jgi:hypothetical protein
VLDLRDYEAAGGWSLLRAGAVDEHEIARLLGG